jgi:hypothetical protein
MIVHIVLFTPRDDLGPSERQRLAASFEHAVRTIPTVRGVTVGKRVIHNARDEDRSDDPAFVAVVAFDDLGGLQQYLQHAAHEELSGHFRRSFSSAAVYDFEVASLDALPQLAL